MLKHIPDPLSSSLLLTQLGVFSASVHRQESSEVPPKVL